MSGTNTVGDISRFRSRSARGTSTLLFLFLCSTVSTFACGQDEGRDPGTDEGKKHVEGQLVPVPEEEIQRLEALGYLDFAPDDAGRDPVSEIPSDAPPPYPGYDLFTVSGLHKATLRDIDGREIRSWQGDEGRWERATLTPDGDLLVVVRLEGRRLLARYGWDGERVWKQARNVHHHAVQAADGRISALSSQMIKSSVIPGLARMLNNWLLILSTEGKVLERRSISTMLLTRPDLFSFEVQTHPDPDALHANYFEWMWSDDLAARDPLYARSNVIVTIREQDTIAVFDYEAGELVWAWGRDELIRPHEATLLCNGNFLVFDNRDGKGWSRVIEVNPLTREIAWEYRGDPRGAFYSATRGTAQRLPNGHTLIGVSNQGRAIEVTPDGTLVWQHLGVDSDDEGNRATLRVNRYEADFVDGLIERKGRPGASSSQARPQRMLAVGCP